MALQDSIRNCSQQFDQALQLVATALNGQAVMQEIARAEALNQYLEHLAVVFDAEFTAIASSASSQSEKLVALTHAFAQQKAAYEAVFSDSANRGWCREQSLKTLQKAFRVVLG